MPKSVHKPT